MNLRETDLIKKAAIENIRSKDALDAERADALVIQSNDSDGVPRLSDYYHPARLFQAKEAIRLTLLERLQFSDDASRNLPEEGDSASWAFQLPAPDKYLVEPPEWSDDFWSKEFFTFRQVMLGLEDPEPPKGIQEVVVSFIREEMASIGLEHGKDSVIEPAENVYGFSEKALRYVNSSEMSLQFRSASDSIQKIYTRQGIIERGLVIALAVACVTASVLLTQGYFAIIPAALSLLAIYGGWRLREEYLKSRVGVVFERFAQAARDAQIRPCEVETHVRFKIDRIALERFRRKVNKKEMDIRLGLD